MNTHPLRSRIVPTLAPRVMGLMLAAWAGMLAPQAASAQTAGVLYERAQSREATARKTPTVAGLRAATNAYEQVVRRYPRSGYCDDALWYGALTARFTWERFRQQADMATATRLLTTLRREYPASKWNAQVQAQLGALSKPAAPPAGPAAAPAVATPPPAVTAPPSAPATLRTVTRSPLPNGTRLTLELDREVLVSPERLAGPERLFFDLRDTQFDAGLPAQLEGLAGSLIASARVGRQDARTIRVVLELAGTPRHSVFWVYHPYRIVIDLEGEAPANTTAAPPLASASAPTPAPPTSVTPAPVPLPILPPAPPSATSGGDYSLARQLGLGISRIVIDAGHGGHDPGAQANGLVESALVLDIALRVEKLLKKRPGIDVVLTRRTNHFIPLEERTAIANREGADLFLSIHANAARRVAAKGVETYFLNFATNADAEAVAARENAGSSTSMGRLPQLVHQIALHDKMKESREFAQIVQTNMVRSMRAQNKAIVDLGVKQAPFVVLIGAKMPSVLAEISFLTNKAEASLLKRDAYKQRIAQALADAVIKYQESLKKVTTTADAGGR
jgi:N-acetylmuramoyl-L-alanine amidase